MKLNNDLQLLEITHLDNPILMETASHLSSSGKLTLSKNNLLYLDIDDAYIHQLYPLLKLKVPSVEIPEYFGAKAIGAHISIIYPEENIVIQNNDLGKEYSFSLKKLVCAKLKTYKNYYVLLIDSPPLLALRAHYGLSDYLNFKGYAIGFHITIGVRYELLGNT